MNPGEPYSRNADDFHLPRVAVRPNKPMKLPVTIGARSLAAGR